MSAENYSLLQEKVMRDPSSYLQEVLQLNTLFENQLRLFELKTPDDSKNFGALVAFLAQVSNCYPEMASFPPKMVTFLHNHKEAIAPELRLSLVRACILLHNRKQVQSTEIFPLFFELFRVKDRPLRDLLFMHIVADLKRLNLKSKDQKLNKILQNFLSKMLQDPVQSAARKAMDVMVSLYQKGIWCDERTVNALATACFSPIPKIRTLAILFFLGEHKAVLGADEEDEEAPPQPPRRRTARSVLTAFPCLCCVCLPSNKDIYDLAYKSTKKSAKRTRKLQAALKAVRNRRQARDGRPAALLLATCRASLAQAEEIKSGSVRLMHFDLISRLIGVHQLLVLNFYKDIMHYLRPVQEEVTRLLAILCQACHPLVPPDALEPVLRRIAHEFVQPDGLPAATAAGINTIREICTRCPFLMTPALLQELSDFKDSKDKGVMMAARSLIQVYRVLNPTMLKKRDRGKFTDIGVKALGYGEARVAHGVEGAEYLSEEAPAPGSVRTKAAPVGEDGEELEEVDNLLRVAEDLEEEARQRRVQARLAGEDVDDDDEDEEGEGEGSDDDDGSEEPPELVVDPQAAVVGEPVKPRPLAARHPKRPQAASGKSDDEDEDDGAQARKRARPEKDAEEEDEQAEGDEGEGKMEAEAEAEAAPAPATAKTPIDQIRFLSDEDLRLLRERRKKDALLRVSGVLQDSTTAGPNGVVDEDDIEGFRAKQRTSLEERRAAAKVPPRDPPQASLHGARCSCFILDSLGSGAEHDHKSHRKPKAGGLSNKQKRKNLPYMVAIHSSGVRSKRKTGSRKSKGEKNIAKKRQGQKRK
ncbi:putative Protein SDA1 [Paratrimastix pyriformis]|uniref:Protein SDA1 n=1 Tax=Paratrimastix pyriformis TaxID=342808 RepID=A0ABQ8UTD5_9EUKA|nr:putative Protein SDA1 [Paratrimastix pyriformis]